MAAPMSPGGDPFVEAVGEAVQTATMAVRLILMIADAARRAAEKREEGEEKALPSADIAIPAAAGELKSVLAPEIATALMSGADWPQMAQQLMALQRAGVDMADFLPRVSEIAVDVRDAVTANAQKIAREGNEQWAKLLRETMPAGPVREAILSSPAWPDIAATMGRLQERGVDVRQILAAAHAEGVGVDQAVARVTAAGAKPVVQPSQAAVRSYGPLTAGLDIPKNLELSNRERALTQLGVGASENRRYVRLVQEALPGKEQQAALLVSARQWPLIAARMARMEDQGLPVAQHLARLGSDTAWEKGPTAQLGSRLVQAASDALRRPVGAVTGKSAAPPVLSAAAKSVSVSVDPKMAAVKSPAAAHSAVVAHRPLTPGQMPGRRR
ncbi:MULTISPECIES: hypothetical protein [Streptomyces]|uniref:Uncharacterized protein n=1 Tax=Streptomyces ehimensis TaxID=68195 RepID=A0ABV9BQW8_9ACTN